MSARGTKEVKLAFGASPRVDLLPPEVGDRKRGAAVRRAVIMSVVGALVLCAGGYAFSSWQAIDAGLKYEEARAETSTLLTQQNEFADVRLLSEQLTTVAAAREVGAKTEIDWSAFYQRVVPTLPAGMTIESFDIDSSSPIESLAAPTTPGQAVRATDVTLVARSADLAAAQTWIVALKALPEYGGAFATSISRNDDGIYTVTVRLMLTELAFSNRFAPPPVEPAPATTEESK